jgi:hypothetical protein
MKCVCKSAAGTVRSFEVLSDKFNTLPRVLVTKTRVWIVSPFVGYSFVVTTNNYNTFKITVNYST